MPFQVKKKILCHYLLTKSKPFDRRQNPCSFSFGKVTFYFQTACRTTRRKMNEIEVKAGKWDKQQHGEWENVKSDKCLRYEYFGRQFCAIQWNRMNVWVSICQANIKCSRHYVGARTHMACDWMLLATENPV